MRDKNAEARMWELLLQPCFRMDLARQVHSYATNVQEQLNRWWQQGKVMRSRDQVNVSFVDTKPGVGKYWRKFSSYLWLRLDSPVVTASGAVTVELPYTERYTLREEKKKQNVMFIAFDKAIRENGKDGWLSQKDVLKFLKSRDVGAVAGEIADYFEVPLVRASGFLNKMRRKGLLERRGYWNPMLAKETPFMGKISGYVYGLPGTDQAKKRIEQGQGLYSPHVNAMLVEIRKDSNQKRFTPYNKFEEEIGQYETLKGVKILTQIYPSLATTIISGQGYIYDKTHLTDEDIDKQTKYWELTISRHRRASSAMGYFHEAFAQKCMDLTLNNMQIKITFWRRIVKGKQHYDIKLSNAKEIDRVLQVDFYHKKQLLWTHLFPIECKFYHGGATHQHLQEFIDKLRFSNEFGETLEVREGNQTLQVHVIKQNAFPILIAPFFKKETYQQAKKYHVELLPTWLLAKLAGEHVGRKLEIKKLFNEYIKNGGNIETYLTQAFKK